jgi:hypothetical protein
MKTELKAAITQLSAERNLPREVVLAALESALASAYKKSMSALEQDVLVKVAPESGEINFYIQKVIVESVANPNREISLQEARKLRATAQLGDVINILVVSLFKQQNKSFSSGCGRQNTVLFMKSSQIGKERLLLEEFNSPNLNEFMSD